MHYKQHVIVMQWLNYKLYIYKKTISIKNKMSQEKLEYIGIECFHM